MFTSLTLSNLIVRPIAIYCYKIDFLDADLPDYDSTAMIRLATMICLFIEFFISYNKNLSFYLSVFDLISLLKTIKRERKSPTPKHPHAHSFFRRQTKKTIFQPVFDGQRCSTATPCKQTLPKTIGHRVYWPGHYTSNNAGSGV